MLCICRVCHGTVEPAYAAVDDLCEACFSLNAEKYHLPGSINYAGRLPQHERKDDEPIPDITRAVLCGPKGRDSSGGCKGRRPRALIHPLG